MGAWLDIEGAALWARSKALIEQGFDASASADTRAKLALDMFAWQRRKCPAIDRVARAFGADDSVQSLDTLPGVPTDAFKSARIACFEEPHTIRVFKTSGTTGDVRGQHPFADTSLYTMAALITARRYLLPNPPYTFVLLAESERQEPHSSLSFMLARFVDQWGNQDQVDPWVIQAGALNVPQACTLLESACRSKTPVAMLGATFAFVHLAHALGTNQRFELPDNSVVMPTGGFKGRERELPVDELLALIKGKFGVARNQIVQEYGMTELSSQGYEAHRAGVAEGTYLSSPWLHVTAVDPVTLTPLPHGRRGILRLIDLANVGSCMAIQTSDFGLTTPEGFMVLGRDPSATPRGCARALDAVLSSP